MSISTARIMNSIFSNPAWKLLLVIGLLSLIACFVTKGKKKAISVIVCVVSVCLYIITTVICGNVNRLIMDQAGQDPVKVSDMAYDIERVFTDDTFKNIIEGNTKPVEIIVGLGGENGYEGFSTKDPAVIEEYINAFRNVTIEDETDDKDRMEFIMDGIVDFTFIIDDETSITIGTDLVQYVTDYDRGIQFHLGNTDAIINLNRSIRE